VVVLADRWRPELLLADERRPTYERLLAEGWQRFFEPPSPTCVHCGGTRLRTLFTTGDHFQQKPGRFTLQRCGDCGVVFQNPRLTPEGLAFYYRDYYDGLGADMVEFAFSSYGSVYRKRAEMMNAISPPRRWLDVGCGQGHFCCAARDHLPGVELHGLDWGASVEEAARRGWIDRAYRGSLPEFAGTLDERYDVVSMFHYLEHVLDPRAELEGARKLLVPGGHVIIEVPEPDSLIGRALGRFWVNWLQPQHLRFLSIRHLDQLLRAQGFTPVAWHRAEAHMPIDLSWAMILVLQRLGPLTDQPWKPRSSELARFRRRLVWTLGAPLVLAAGACDRLIAALARPLRSWNLYRVVARVAEN
jgi:SAM-dependent methyltransferase